MKGISFAGNIIIIRAIEDCIRASKRYTEGVGTMRKHHPQPDQQIQGEDITSKMFVKHYEVYPEMEPVGWDMPADAAIDLLWGDTPCVDVTFRYDYRINMASMIVHGDIGAVKALARKIPTFCDLIKPDMTTNGHRELVAGAVREAKEEIEAARVAKVAEAKALERAITPVKSIRERIANLNPWKAKA